MDTMTYLRAPNQVAYPRTGSSAWAVSSTAASFKYYLSTAMGCTATDLQAVVVGGHGDTP